jgi:RNA polymerase sigma factor (sigma-70 family)
VSCAPTDRESLILNNLGLAGWVAKRFVGRGLDWDDLVSAGYVGLIEAANRFDPAMGVRFSTYAPYWIRQAIGRAIHQGGSTIQVPYYLKESVKHWDRTAYMMVVAGPVTEEAIAAASGLSPLELARVQAACNVRYCLNSSDLPNSWRNVFLSHLADNSVPDDLDAGLMVGELREMMARLPDYDWLVLALRFGLGGCAPLDYRTIGKLLGVRRAVVSGHVERVLDRLRTTLGADAS